MKRKESNSELENAKKKIKLEPENGTQTYNIVGNLPPETAQEISLYLSGKDLDNAWNCCMAFRRILDYQHYWRERCRKVNYKDVDESSPPIMYDAYLGKSATHWQSVYKYNQLCHNWKDNNFRSIDLKSKYPKNTYLLSFPNNRIENMEVNVEFSWGTYSDNNNKSFYYFDDEVIITKNMLKNRCDLFNYCTDEVKTIWVARCVKQVVKHFNLLVVLTTGGYITVLSIASRFIIYNKKISKTGLKSMIVHKNIIGVIDKEETFYVLNINTNTIDYKSTGILCMCCDDNVIALGSHNGIIRILEFNNYKTWASLDCDEPFPVWKVMIKHGYLIGITNLRQNTFFGNAFVWNLKEKVKLYKVENIFGFREWISLNHNSLTVCTTNVSNPVDFTQGKIITMDLATGTPILQLDVSNEPQFIISNSSYVFMSTYRDVQAWCSKTGLPLFSVLNVGCLNMKVTETKMAYTKDNGDIHIRDYELNIDD